MPLPVVLTQKFARTQEKQFLLKNREALNQCTPLLNKDPVLAYTLIKSWFAKSATAQFEKTVLNLLKKIYPQLTMEIFIKDLVKIITLVEAYSILVQCGGHGAIYAALQKLIEQKISIEDVLELINLVSHEIAHDTSNNNRDSLSASFLTELKEHPEFLNNITTKPVLALILNYYLNVKIKNVSLPLLFALNQTLIPLEIERATKVATILLANMRNSEAYQFFSKKNHLTAQQIEGITQILEQVDDLSVSLPFLQQCLQQNPEHDFILILNKLNNLHQEHKKHLLLLCNFICSSSTQPILQQFDQLKKIPERTLNQLAHLTHLYPIEKIQFLALLASPSVTEAITQFKRKKQAENIERYHYNPEIVAEKITRIKHKLPNGNEVPLSSQKQEQLLKDYKQLMSYMTNNPVLIEKDSKGISKKFTINELDESQFPLLLKQINEQIRKGKNKHDYQLMLLALCCEALYRTTGKFPRDTQILNLTTELNYHRNLIHEVQTGEGKSIIAALHAVLLYDGKCCIDVVTENNHLANEGLTRFRPFFHYFGIACGDTIIEAQSNHSDYIEGSINYSTASSLALFRARMKMQKKYLSKNVALVCDEIDANLTTLVQFRLSATLDPLLLDIKSWSVIYQCLLDFVEEKEIFIHNKCDNQDDVSNFKIYFTLRHPGKELTDFFNRLNNELLSNLIDESYVVVHGLEENINYFVLPKNGKNKSLYAAPILASTKRPDPRISYCASTQQLLHTRLNNRKPPPQYAFEIEPCSETFLTITAKNFFDFYRLNGGCTIGLTGTAGSDVELQEFNQNHGLLAINYPTYYQNKCEDLGFFAAFGSEAHQQLIFKKIQEHKNNRPDQPILIITNSPQDTLRINNYLAANTSWDLQSYSGYEQEGTTETQVIRRAGMNNMVTIANESLARGADISPANQHGLFVINACTDVTASGLRQIKGRAGRNGKDGSFCSIIDATKIASPTDTLEEIATAFLAHQHHLSLLQQKQRLKTRLLEESRYYIVNDHILELREQADRILSRNYGSDSVLVSDKELMKPLSTLNHRAERHYNKLLESNSSIEGAVADEFLAARVADYQQVLEQWLPDKRFNDFKPTEPLIPLENIQKLTLLHSVTMEQLTLLSELLSQRWKQVGHQNMMAFFIRLDELIETLHSYFRKERSLKHIVAETILNYKLLDESTIIDSIEGIKKTSSELLVLGSRIPVIGSYIPTESIANFIIDYFNTTKTQIKEKKWDDVTLPGIEFSAINLWFNRISTAMSISSLGTSSPTSFIINKIVLPTVIDWLTDFFKNKFANKESSYIHLLKELSNLSPDLIKAVNTLTSLANTPKVTLGFFLDNVAPLLKHKAFVNMAIKYLELNEQSNLIPFVQVIPALLKSLEPYRDKKIHELLHMKTLVPLFYQICQLEEVKKAITGTEFKNILSRMSCLTPECLLAFGQLSFKEFVALTKVIAHPDFANFLQKLPPQTTFTKLIQWLQEESEDVPKEVEEALDELWTYQSHREQISEENKQILLTLKEKFSLSLDKLKTGLAHIAPVPSDIEETNNVLEVITPAPQKPWLMYGAIAIGLMLIVLCNVFFFCAPVLITSLVLLGLLAYPIIKYQIMPMFAARPESNQPKAEQSIEPILVYTKSNQQDDTLERTKSNIPNFQKQQIIPSIKVEKSKKYRFFGQTREEPIPSTPDLPSSYTLNEALCRKV